MDMSTDRVTYTVTRELRPGLFQVVKEDLYFDGENIEATYDFRGAISAPGIEIGMDPYAVIEARVRAAV